MKLALEHLVKKEKHVASPSTSASAHGTGRGLPPLVRVTPNKGVGIYFDIPCLLNYFSLCRVGQACQDGQL